MHLVHYLNQNYHESLEILRKDVIYCPITGKRFVYICWIRILQD